MTEEEYVSALLAFVRREFLSDSDDVELTAATPLIESGVLDSLRIAVLMAFIRDEFAVQVPLTKIDVKHFADIRTIAAMLHEEQGVRA
ncbi:acyl carrier protein [Lentzea sp.]|uniref:acyl carrier protein n=1 Tax=Lentzea sp. TaxID=56099 RepID=UPI002C9597A6|nr:phosphopantetheine-binding protein [Lentzea sp.]HUQ57178.1 phosphopantetheine-binding protein [Lentzea sp.]